MGGISDSMVNAVLDLLGIASIYDSTKISNIEAATGASPIAGLGFDAAPPIDIIIEDQTKFSTPSTSKNYSQQALTDALAVYQTYAQIAPSLTQNQLSALIDAFGTNRRKHIHQQHPRICAGCAALYSFWAFNN